MKYGQKGINYGNQSVDQARAMGLASADGMNTLVNRSVRATGIGRCKFYVPILLFVLFVAAEVFVLDKCFPAALAALEQQVIMYGVLILTGFVLLCVVGLTIMWRLEAMYDDFLDQFDFMDDVFAFDGFQDLTSGCTNTCNSGSGFLLC